MLQTPSLPSRARQAITWRIWLSIIKTMELCAEIGVGTVKHKKVGKACDGHAEIRFRPTFPGLMQVLSAQAGDLHRYQEIRRGKSRGENDAIYPSLDSVFADHGAWTYFFDVLRHQFDVGAVHGRI